MLGGCQAMLLLPCLILRRRKGNKRMLRIISRRRAEKIIAAEAEKIRSLECRYGLPCAYLQAILLKEMTEIDVLDLAADLAVKLYWIRYDMLSLARRILKQPPLDGFPEGLLKKRDSSTGYAQIFAYVAIRAIAFSLENGLDDGLEDFGLSADHPLRETNPADLRLIWRRLNRDTAFNLRAAALNLIAAAEEMTGRIDFSSYTPEEIQAIFTRYNANTRVITAYGRETYQYYLIYRGYAQDAKQNVSF